MSKTGDTTRRFVAPYITDASSHILPFTMLDLSGGRAQIHYNSAPYRALSGGVQTSTFTSVSFASTPASSVPVLPAAVCDEVLYTLVTTGHATQNVPSIELSSDGTNADIAFFKWYSAIAMNPQVTGWLPVIRATPSVQYRVGHANNPAYIDVGGYRFLR